ncbi:MULTISPECIES: hypothetical protein [unclassified Roseovarius]|uniref:hypothetical protein n=1 Tax=unclassified Roseovarius TaxID=2614913 RepID=UPI00273E6E57|nr:MULTISPECIES: hypothetical protein [unclassified Roseovarius]
MARADFQDRLQRIGTQPPNHDAAEPPSPKPKASGRQTMHHGLMAVGAIFMAASIQALKYAYQNHEAMRESGAFGTLAGLVIGGVVALLIGAIAMLRAIPKKDATNQDATQPEHPVRQPSAMARVLFSLLGVALGSIAILYMFMGAAVRFLPGEKAQLFSAGSVVIALALLGVSLLFGLVSLFLRGYALGRVPVYFVLGGIFTYAVVQIARVNFLEWDGLVAALQ